MENNRIGTANIFADEKPFFNVPVFFPHKVFGGTKGLRLAHLEETRPNIKAEHVRGWYRDEGNPETNYPYTVTVLLEIKLVSDFGTASEEEVLSTQTAE